MKLKNVEDIYPLSPMQQGMLFHSLYAPDSGQYFQQVSCTLEGELHIPTFELAWQRVAQRYPALRTAFFWEGLQEPLQVVRQQLAIDFRHYDWREFLGSDRQEKLERLLQTDLQSGFHLAQAPLMRFHLIRHQEQSYRLIWSYHHILLDGWCLSPILNDVFSLYDALCRGDNLHLPSVRPYRDYIQWLQQQETTSSERFWTNYLAAFNAPTPLPHCGKQAVFQEEQLWPAYQEQQFQVSQEITRRLQRLAQQQRATLNVIMQAAWAILLSRYSGETDVVFGAT
ncbi:MAG: non-ribosomal peptide synthetase, partial [bacterium]|nr:non-ribosomal peptide synthetase [bacterium]